MDIKKLLSAMVQDTGWVDIDPSKGTWDYFHYRVVNKTVFIEGYATAYAWSGNTGDVIAAASELPAEYRPSVNKDTVVRGAGSRWGQILVTSSGQIVVDRILTGTTPYTDTNWVRFNVCYPIEI